MNCPNCQNKLPNGARFCNRCGTPVGADAPANPAAPAAPAAPSAPPPPPQAAQPAPPPPPPAPVPAAPQSGPLRYNIFGDNMPAVSIRLNPGESIYTQSGGMAWMDNGITMSTNMKGGLLKGLGRMVSGESLFIATYTANMPDQEIVVASTFPGHIMAMDVTARPIIAQKGAFLCAQSGVQVSAYLNKSLKSGFFGGEGFVMQRMAGAGMLFLEIDGSLAERTLAPGETIKVDTGNVAAFEETVRYQAEMVKGFRNVLFGGEGLFLTTLTGPGKVWLQTMTIPTFAKRIIPYLPTNRSN